MERIKSSATELARIASPDTLTLTPNNRTAVNLTERVVKYKLEQTNKKACELPNVFPLNQWVMDAFSQLRLNNVAPFNQLSIISDDALISYWVKMMCSSGMEALTDRLPEILNADKFMSRWEVTDYTPDSVLSANFAKWRKAVHAQIAKHGFITPSQAIEHLIFAIEEGRLSLPDNVATFAFDEVPPLYQSLFDAISRKSNFIVTNPIREENQWLSVQADSEEQQLEYAAQWASKIIEEQPGKSVAIVHPTLHANRDRVVKALNDVFMPQWVLPGNTHIDAPYDISIGVPLLDTHIAKRALFYCGIEGNTIKTSNIASIINDPWLMSDDPEIKKGRRKFELVMRDCRTVKSNLIDLAKNSSCPIELSKKLSDYAFHMQSAPEYLAPSKWASFFSAALEKLEFAKDKKITIRSHGAIKKLHSVFDSFAALDAHTGQITKSLAINIIMSIARKTQVTPENKGSPIYILGALEASGLDFDYTWVLDCNQSTFPQAAAPNGFLPLDMQVKLNMPHSSCEREYQFADKLFNRFKGSCSVLIASYLTQKDGVKLKKSFVLDAAKEITNIQDHIDDDIIDYDAIAFQRYSTESITESFPKITSKYLPGGVSLVDNASGCLMKAYFTNEMGIKESRFNNTMGLTGIEKGNVTHGALEEIWSEIKAHKTKYQLSSDHAALLQMTDDELVSVIDNALASALFWIDRNDISVELLKAESQLIARNIKDSLTLDVSRDPFNVVEIESTKTVEIGENKIQVRLDRVDELVNMENNQNLLALDYKTSEESVSKAFSSSFKSQLPLSALAVSAGGVGYHNVVQNNCNISGIVNEVNVEHFKAVDSHRFNGPKNWEELTQQWKQRIETAITKFTSGELSYKPNQENCAYCVKRRTCPYSI